MARRTYFPKVDFSPASRRIGVRLTIVCVVAFALLTGLVASGRTRGADAAILEWLSRERSPILTTFFTAITALGSPTDIYLLTAGAAIGLALLGRPGMAAALAIAVVGGEVLSDATKLALERARPTEVTHIDAAWGFSFPSGHTVNAMSFWVTLALLCGGHVEHQRPRRFLVGFAVSIGALVAVSRLYLGVHYPSDTLGGALLGLAWATTVVLAEYRLRHGGPHPAKPLPAREA